MTECQDVEYSLEDKFYACVDIIQAMPKSGPLNPTIAEKLKMYSLFKQVTVGPCNTQQPGFWNLIERYKWNAWKELGDLDRNKAMEIYVAHVVDKIDYCAQNWNWDEMMTKYGDDYDKMGPILRVKFRIIDRELIKEDGTRVNNAKTESTSTPTIPEETPTDPILYDPFATDAPRESTDNGEESTRPNTRSSAYSVGESRTHSPRSKKITKLCAKIDGTHSPRSKKITKLCAKIDAELRAINATLNAIAEAAEARHKAVMKVIKNSAIVIAVPSRHTWRFHIFLLIWPFFVHWAIKYSGGILRELIKITYFSYRNYLRDF